MSKKVTQADIAKALNISRVTVSKVLNNFGVTSKETRQMVLDTAREIGYRFNEDQTNDLDETPENRRITFVCYSRDFNCSYWASIIRGMADALAKEGYSLGIVLLPDRMDSELPMDLRDPSVVGILAAGTLSPDYFAKLLTLNKTMVSLDINVSLYNEDLVCDVVLAENFYGINNTVKFLCRQGYREFAYIGGIHCMQSFYERWAGFSLALLEYGIPIRQEWMATDGDTFAYYAPGVVEEIVKAYQTPPEVIVCFNDSIIPRLNKLKQEGVIPENVVLVGFDNSLDFASHSQYDFNVECYPENLGRVMAETMVLRLKNPDRRTYVVRTMVKPVIPEYFKK